MKFDKFFHPASVALVGARPEDGHVGSALMKNLLAGAPRTIYPVAHDHKTVLGVPAYRTIEEVPGPVDLAVIAVPAPLVADVLRSCAKKKVSAAVVISAGFKEAGEEGVAREDELRAIGRESGLPFLGPNCLGVIDAHADLNASFASHKPKKGAIGFLSQSGAIGTAFIEWSRSEGVGISKFVSLGNEAGISEVEMLEYLGNDPKTKAILVYLEHVSDGARLLAVAKTITGKKKKPIVLLRSGRSARGMDAVMSHTGSLAPEDAVFTAACRQSGIATVTSLRDLFNAAKLLSLDTAWGDTTRLAVVTNGGGPSVNAADLIELSESMELVRFDEATRAKLHAALPFMAAVGNPVDVIGDAGADRYRAVLDILLAKDDIDAIMIIVTPQMMTDAGAIAEIIVERKDGKQLVPVFMGGEVMAEGIRVLEGGGMVNFDLPSDPIAALDALTPKKKSPHPPDTHAPKPLTMLSFEKMSELLAAQGLSVLGSLARTKADAVRMFSELGLERAALKIVSQDIVHKTEVKALRLNLKSAEEVGAAWDEITASVATHTPPVTLEGMLIQPMATGKEVIVGMKRDPTFGPVLVFGLGGIFVELLNDVAMRIAPFTEDEAKTMVSEIAGARYLDGFRGTDPADIAKLAKLLVAVGNLAVAHPEIEEIDLNPVIATKNEAYIVDARLMARR